ncbi:hypothetical protein DV495_000871 [Geotrichum candidum]|uniref:Cytosolic Fe-S cluster assembly factor NAR1 n=1 Tax=Geotrichum candidum TaxID=1173061 RepID=A0A0J9XCS1_GEOCN|nr:hypothetical protein DV454_001348 [Geotrichum candidum]KAI9213624.1 hypothetical protein DS838_001497 [Geotrichum bryndzae]KAF5121566.1 hypothetical protein DV452_000735 [Geotrichum candidum]KAF5135370.1 hypothetical protein DV495_000871 [Geotrichum candidum]KAF7500359.1 hypothetical protein DV113_001650 [Geotrichum candidum]
MSAILSVDDLNDFISPGVACIKPVEIKKTNESGKAKIEISMDGIPTEITEEGKKANLDKAQISLSDCLACSGCITSAESVLVSLQSHDELLSSLRSEDAKEKVFVASISHQSRVSLAGAYGISVEQVDAKLRHLFVDILGFKYIVGLEIGRAISLNECLNEVLESRSNVEIAANSAKASKGPILCSSCPGWTCYVEKTHPHVIPYLSKVKSPQQITGSLLKDLISKELSVAKGNIYHLSVMPCFDKKLEAARPEFGSDSENNTYRDVDCVITAKEIVQLLISEGIAFESLSEEITEAEKAKSLAPTNWPIEQQWTSNPGSSSGGYMDFVIQGIQQRIEEPTRVEVLPGKNSDITEYRVISEADPSKIYFRTARIYGFRNIQNLVRKLKQKGDAGERPGKAGLKMARARVTSRRTPTAQALSDATQYDYVEVMACPGGCINGGGQIGMPDGKNAKEWKDELEILYSDIEDFSKTLLIDNEKSSYSVALSQLAASWVERLWEKKPRDELLRVEYHAVEDILATTEDPNLAPLALGTKW